jgi:hypothetical protein
MEQPEMPFVPPEAPPGQAVDRDSSTQTTAADDLVTNLSRNVLETFVLPEVKRRDAKGGLPPDFRVIAVQIVMEVDRVPVVRLNEEVQVAAYLRQGAMRTEEVGQTMDVTALLPDIEEVSLVPEDQPNAAHITMVMTPAGWSIWFDLRYNGARIKGLLQAAREFLEAAQASHLAGLSRPMIADLFTAVELLAKARLWLHPIPELLASKRHGMIHAGYNRQAGLGNVDPRFAKLLNRLSDLRDGVRYSPEPPQVTVAQQEEFLSLAREMWSATEVLLPRRIRDL